MSAKQMAEAEANLLKTILALAAELETIQVQYGLVRHNYSNIVVQCHIRSFAFDYTLNGVSGFQFECAEI